MKNDPPSPARAGPSTSSRGRPLGRRHHPGIAGIHLDPTLFGLAPFVYSGGGDPFDDDTSPTSLALSDEPNVSSLTQTVQALQEPGSNLSERQLRDTRRWSGSPTAGWRCSRVPARMVPDLRAVAGSDFDVMPMPSLGLVRRSATSPGCASSAEPERRRARPRTSSSTPTRRVPSRWCPTAATSSPRTSRWPCPTPSSSPGGGLTTRPSSASASRAWSTPDRRTDSDQLDLAVDPMLEPMLRGTPAEVPRTTRQIDRASFRVIGPRLGPPAPVPRRARALGERVSRPPGRR